MHIITQQRIGETKEKYPAAMNALDGWYRIMKQNKFDDFSQLKQSFNSVNKVRSFYVFDVGRNKLRIITQIHFNYQKVYIRDVLTHVEYDKGNLEIMRDEYHESSISTSY